MSAGAGPWPRHEHRSPTLRPPGTCERCDWIREQWARAEREGR